MNYFKINFWFFSFFLILSVPVFSQNLALKKSYYLSVKPNYIYSAPSSDTSSLTDGIYTTSDGRFWAQPTTVGWLSENVSITIDLDKIQPIASVLFSTVRPSGAGGFYPKNIFVFFSNDDINYRYIGDAADVADNLPGPSHRKIFSLNKINESARFVRISVIREGKFLFCDEIEVLKGKRSSNNSLAIIKRDSLQKVEDSLQNPKYNRRSALRQNQRLPYLLNDSLINFSIKNNDVSFDLDKLQTNVGIINASYLKEIFKKPYILEKGDSWSNLDKFRSPTENNKLPQYKFYLTTTGVQYGSFVLTNLNPTRQIFYFTILSNGILRTDLFTLPFVPSSFYNEVPDPMLKVNDQFTLNPGESRLFIFKMTGLKNGKIKSTILITSEKYTSKIEYDVDIIDTFERKNLEPLNVNVWANFKSKMIVGHEIEASKDLKEHYVNTFVIPPSSLPGIKDTNFYDFSNYLKNFYDAKNVLLFMGYSLLERRNGYKNGEFMSPEWKQYFIKWYNNMLKIISKCMGSETNIYLYPFDEVSKNNVSDFKNLVLWSRSIFPDIKFYGTFDNQNSIDSLLSIVNVAQIARPLAKNLPSHNCEIWIYTANSPSRALDPYGFYRLMAWDAFANDYSGIGFWNYAVEGNGNHLNLVDDKYLNLGQSYSVIYNDTEGDIIPSRRWEAFRLGIEDYSILQAYSGKFGLEKTKVLAEQVVNSPNRQNVADSIRDKMIIELSAKKN